MIPFENATHEPRLYWLAEASAVVLTDDLVALGAQALSRDDRLRAFEQFHVPPVATLSDATIIRVGQVVGAEQVVVGAFDLKDDTLTVRARAIRLDTGRMFPEIAESGPLNDLFGVYARVARRLVPDSTVSTEQMERGHPSLPAFEQYVKGVLAENPATQAFFLKEALRLAPDFQRARLSLWTVYTEQAEHQQAFNIARQVPADHPLSRQARFLAAISLMNLGRNADAFGRADGSESREARCGAAQRHRRRAAAPAGRIDRRRAGRLVLQAGGCRQPERSRPLLQPRIRLLAGARHAERGRLAAGGRAAQPRRRCGALRAGSGAAVVGERGGGAAGEGSREAAVVDVCRLGSEAARRQRRPRAVSSASRCSSMPRARRAWKTRSWRPSSAISASWPRSISIPAAGCFQAERDAEAIAELRRAIYLSPYDREAHLLLGRLYLRDGRVQDAIDELKISIWSDDQIDAHLALADAYTQAKNVAAARSRAAGRVDARSDECRRAAPARSAPSAAVKKSNAVRPVACYNPRTSKHG